MKMERNKRMQFDYYYGAEADQFNFIKVPKAMIKDSAFAWLNFFI